jgi:hypothetical protein
MCSFGFAVGIGNELSGTGANRLGESVKVFSLTNWWPMMSKRKGLEGLFDGRHFDRERRLSGMLSCSIDKVSLNIGNVWKFYLFSPETAVVISNNFFSI